MKVVASNRGMYGTMRREGDEFTLSTKDHFSERWMVSVAKEPKRAAALVAEANGGPATVTENQIAAEMGDAMGRNVEVLTRENDALKARIADLEGELAGLQGADVEAAVEAATEAGEEAEVETTAEVKTQTRKTRRRK